MTPTPRRAFGPTLLLACHYGAASLFDVAQLFVTTHIGAYGGPAPGSIHSSLVLLPGGVRGEPVRPLGLQAVPLRVGPYAPNLMSRRVRYYDTGLDAASIEDVWGWATAQVGAPYDFVGLGWCALYEIEHRLGVLPDVTQAFLDSPRAALFCSAYAGTALRRRLPDLAPGVRPDNLAPAYLEQEAIRIGLRRWRVSHSTTALSAVT